MNEPQTQTSTGMSTGTKVVIGALVVISLVGIGYFGYTKFVKKPADGAGDAAGGEDAQPGAGSGEGDSSSAKSNSAVAQTKAATSEIKTSGGGTTTSSKPGSSGGGGSSESSNKGTGGGGGNGTIRTDFDKTYNYKKTNGIWFTAKKSAPAKWISLEKNQAAADKLNAKYPNG